MQLLNYNCLQNQRFPQCGHVRKKTVLQDCCSKRYSVFSCILNLKLLAYGLNLACKCVVWSVVCVSNCISCHRLKMLWFHLNIWISGFSLPKLENVHFHTAFIDHNGVAPTRFRQEGHAFFRTPQTPFICFSHWCFLPHCSQHLNVQLNKRPI